MKTHSTDETKESLEIQKIEWEIEHLKRPWYRNPGAITAIIATLLAITTAITGSKLSEIQSKQAQLEKEKNEYLLLKVTKNKELLDRQIQEARNSLSDTLNQRPLLINEPPRQRIS